MTGKRKLVWAGVIVAAFVILVGVAGYVTLRSSAFHNFLLAKVEQRASEATGAQVKIQNLVIHLSGLTADAYGITMRSPGAGSQRPLLQADQLSIRLKIISLLRKKVDLHEIVLRHPVLNLQVGKNGDTNLPTPPRTDGNSSTNLFDLGIEHVLIRQGEIYYNDVKTPMDAELHDLQLELKSEGARERYYGTLSYRNGHVQYAGAQPLPHDLQVGFDVTPNTLTLNPLILTVASSTLEFRGKVQNYAHPVGEGAFRLRAHPQDFAAVLKNATVPAGEVSLDGALRYQYEANASVLRALVLEGDLNSRQLLVNSADLRGSLSNLRAHIKLADGNFDADGIRADLLNGHLDGAVSVQHLDGNQSARVRMAVRSISIAATSASLKTARRRRIPIEGFMSATADANWMGSVKTIQLRSHIDVKATLANASGSAPATPLTAAGEVSYDGPTKVATLTNTYARTPRTSVFINGTAGQKLDLTVQAHAEDLREFASLVDAFQSAGEKSRRVADIGGAADAQLFVQGSIDDPRVHGQLKARELQVENTQWRSLDLEVEANRSSVSVKNGSLVNAHQGYANFSFSSGLSDWRLLPSSPLDIQLNSHGLAIAQLLQAAKLNYPVSGDLSADVAMHGSLQNPAGKGSVRLTKAEAYGQPLQFSAQFEGNLDTVRSSLNVSTAAGSAQATVTFNPKSKVYEFQLNAPSVRIAQLQIPHQKKLQLSGVLSLSASGRGTMDNPQLTASLEIPQLRAQRAGISGVKADITIANHKAQLAVDSQVAESFIQARGTVDLTGDYYTRATLNTKSVPIEGLIALYAPANTKSNGPRGTLEVHASLEGPLRNLSRLQADVTIPVLKAGYQGIQISNTQPIRIRCANAIVTLDPTEISGTDTTLRLAGQLPLKGGAPATLSASGTVDMALLRFFQPDMQSSGKILLDVRATGTAARPNVNGKINVQNVSLVSPDAPLGLQNVSGVLDISNDRVTVTQLSGESGGGTISATGVIAYRPQVEMNLALQAKNVRVRYQDSIRTLLDGDLNLVGTAAAANLSGRVLIDSLSFTPNFDLASFVGQIQSGPESTPSEGIAQNVKLNITVQTSRDLNLASSQVSLQGQANLRVIGTAAEPVIVGRTAFTRGDIFLLNQRYQIERGTIDFANPNRTEPVLNVLLTTTINQYNLSLTFVGPIEKIHTTYISDPQLSTADIINLIVRGQTAQQSAASPSNLGASSLLAQGAASQVSGGIQKLTGLSSLSIDPTLGGNDADPGARIALQKRLTSNFLFTFATDVTSTQREIIQGEYQINRRWSATVTRDENGGFAIDGKYHRRF